MKILAPFSVLMLAVAVPAVPVSAQTAAPDATTPAPAVSAPAAPVLITGTIYVAQLPTPAQLTKDAEAEGVVVSRIEQTAGQMLVTYQYRGGTTRTYAYLPMSVTGEVPAGVPVATAAPGTATVVYAEPETVYYGPRYVRYYDPTWDFWAPLAIGVGLGWGFAGHGHYYYHPAYHGGWHR